MAEFQWAPGSACGIAASVAGDELERIRRANGGELRPRDVVHESRAEDAPLHPCFTWDDQAAAEKCRENEARQIIRSVRVIVKAPDREPVRVPAYVHIRQDTGRDQQRYLPTVEAIQDDAQRERILEDARRLLAGIQARYGHLQELAEVIEAIQRLARPAA